MKLKETIRGNFNIMSKNLKVFLGIVFFFILLKGYIFFYINPSIHLNPIIK